MCAKKDPLKLCFVCNDLQLVGHFIIPYKNKDHESMIEKEDDMKTKLQKWKCSMCF